MKNRCSSGKYCRSCAPQNESHANCVLFLGKYSKHSFSTWVYYHSAILSALRTSPPLPQQALVRISLKCFRRTGGKALDTHQGGCDEPAGPGYCLRALLTHMWWKLHHSSELALNGVRAGGARHRSSIQKVRGLVETTVISRHCAAVPLMSSGL